MAIIIGIDPSLTGTGIARVDTDDRLVAETWTVTSKGKAGDDLATRRRRLRDLIMAIRRAVHVPDLVLIEAPAYSSRTGHMHDRSGLWWLLVDELALMAPVVEVTAGGVKKYATGKGNAGKDEVLLAVARRYPHVDVRDNNQADALVLAAMGADHAGTPLVELPKVHREALAKVAWPAPHAGDVSRTDLMVGAGQ